jgi:hypothetical protein
MLRPRAAADDDDDNDMPKTKESQAMLTVVILEAVIAVDSLQICLCRKQPRAFCSFLERGRGATRRYDR